MLSAFVTVHPPLPASATAAQRQRAGARCAAAVGRPQRTSAFVAPAPLPACTPEAALRPRAARTVAPSMQQQQTQQQQQQQTQMQKAQYADYAPKHVHADAAVSAAVSEVMARKNITKPVIIGVAADSGAGKSTFLRRVQKIFGAEVSQSHTPQGAFMSVICLDDYHIYDRPGRKEAGITALDEQCQNFGLMHEQIAALKRGHSVAKPIYNHDTGNIDAPELIEPNHIIVVEGLHPMFDERVRELLDFSVYLDLDDEVKVAWKIQRDMAERGHSLDNILASIEARKPDFDRFVDVQKQHADVVFQIKPTELIKDDEEKKILRVRMLQKEGVRGFSPVYLFDEGSTIDWIPCGRRLTCSYPGIKFRYGPETYYGADFSTIEVDGEFDKLEELVYIESHLSTTATKYFGELTQLLLADQSAPGARNGTALFQQLIGLKVRETYEQLTGRKIDPVSRNSF